MTIKFYRPAIAASYRWLYVAVFLGYFSALVCYFVIKPTWLASLELQVPPPAVGKSSQVSGVYDIINSDYRKLFDSVGDPVFTAKLTESISKPELFNYLLDKRFAGRGYMQVVERSDKKLTVIVRSIDRTLSLTIVDKIRDMILSEIAEDRHRQEAYLLAMRNDANSYLSALMRLNLQNSFPELASKQDHLTLADVKDLALIADYLNTYRKALHNLKYETNLLDYALSRQSTTGDIRVITYMYPEQAWPRPKFFILLGTLLAGFLVILVLLKYGFVYYEKNI